MDLYLTLLRQFVLRGMAREKTRAAVSVIGVSLGVAVLVAIRLANQSALDAFRGATEAVAGGTSLEVEGVNGRFDELLLRDLLWLRDFGEVSPVVDGFARLPPESGPAGGEFLRVLGVDVLRDRSLRSYWLLRLTQTGRQPSGGEFLRLLADPQAVILTAKLARRQGLDVGDRVELLVDDRRLSLTIRGLLVDEGPARVMDGHFALLDIATAQKAFRCYGLLDRVDIKLREDLSLDEARKAVAERLPPALRVKETAERTRQVETMIASFHFNLTALGSLALLVGLFLVYNTTSFSVVRRRREIGRLRAVGVGRGTILALFLGEALLLATPGTLAGVFLGRLLAAGTVTATAMTVETFYIADLARESARSLSLGAAEWLLAFGAALPLALVAAWVPAREATRVAPAETLRGTAGLAGSSRRPRRALAASLALALLAYLLSRLGPVAGLPLFAYGAALSLLFSAAFLVPPALRAACRWGDRWVFRRIPGLQAEGLLASSSLGQATPRIAVSVAALAFSLAMTVAIAIMVGSFRQTVIYWMDETLRADIYVRPASRAGSLSGGSISPGAVELIRSDPQVAAVDTLFRLPVDHEGRQIHLGAHDLGVLIEHGSLQYKAPGNARERVRHARDSGGLLVSESFSLRFDKHPGDRVELATRRGKREFEVAAVFYDYSNNRGVVHMDVSTWREFFSSGPDEGPRDLAVYLEPGSDADEVKARLARASSGEYQLLFRKNAEVRQGSLAIFDSTFAITYALQGIAITVAALGVISTLITLLLERRQEFAVLRFLGATRAQLRRMVVLEALLLGTVGQVVGLGVGCLLSLLLIFVVNVQSFGWTIQLHLPLGYLLQSTLFVVLAAAVAGLYPAARAARVRAVHFVGEG